MRVFICDDEPEIVEMLSFCLGEKEFDVQTFVDPRDVLRTVRQTPCDILVTDVRMESLDGIELTEQMSKLVPDCKVIVITGCLGAEEEQQCVAGGAYACVAKPFKIDHVVGLVCRAANELELSES